VSYWASGFWITDEGSGGRVPQVVSLAGFRDQGLPASLPTVLRQPPLSGANPLTALSDDLAHNAVNAIAIDAAGHKWFGTWRGVSVFISAAEKLYLPLLVAAYAPSPPPEDMVLVAAGAFQMGCHPDHNAGHACPEDEPPLPC